MKIKINFVTNSSSSSFIIAKENITDLQVELIINHIDIAKVICEREDNLEMYYDEWGIYETDTHISGETMMDNFDMCWFLEQIGIEPKHVEWDNGNIF